MNEHGHRLAKQLTPAAADSPRTKSRAYALMSETLLDNSGEIFDHGRPVSHCIIHNKLCPVFDTDIGANRCSDAGTPCVYAIATDSEIELQLPEEVVSVLFRIIAKRPACVVGFVFVACAVCTALLVSLGSIGLSISVGTSLFIDSSDIHVQRGNVQGLLHTSTAFWDLSWLDTPGYIPFTILANAAPSIPPMPPATPPTPPEMPHNNLLCDEDPGIHTIEIVYSSKSGGNVLTPAALQQVLLIETRIRTWAEDAAACTSVGPQCHCELLDSVVNYVFPRVVVPAEASTSAPSALTSPRGIQQALHIFARVTIFDALGVHDTKGTIPYVVGLIASYIQFNSSDVAVVLYSNPPPLHASCQLTMYIQCTD